MDGLVILSALLTEIVVIALQVYWAISKNMPQRGILIFAGAFAGILGLIILSMGLHRLRKYGSRSLFIWSCIPLVILAVLTPYNLAYVDSCDKRIESGGDITHCDFSEQDLSSADLAGRDLSHSYFFFTNLQGADLSGAILADCGFDGADLTGVDLTGAVMTSSRFETAILTGATLIDADLRGSDFKSAELTNANLSGADLTGADFEAANLRNSDLTNANLTDVNFNRADLSNAVLTNATLKGTLLTNVSGLTDVILASVLGIPMDDLPEVAGRDGIRLETSEQMLQALIQVCDGGALPGNPAYTGNGEYHPYFTAAFNHDDVTGKLIDETHAYNIWYDYDIGTAAARFTELVGCVEQHQKTSLCGPYMGVGVSDMPDFTRLQYEATYSLRVARTGEVIDTQILRSTLVECPETITESSRTDIDIGTGDDHVWLLKGATVPSSAFDDWLRTIIRP